MSCAFVCVASISSSKGSFVSFLFQTHNYTVPVVTEESVHECVGGSGILDLAEVSFAMVCGV